MTDFDIDVARIDEALSAARSEPETGGPDVVTRVAQLHLHRAALTGRSDDYNLALRTIVRALKTWGPWPDLCLLQADLHTRFHRIGDARRELARAPGLLECTQGRAILADILLQEGDFTEAEELVVGLVSEERTWDHLARLAHMASCRGDLQRADAIFVEAEDEITAKSMRSFAWVEMERGRLRVVGKDLPRARAHYSIANRAYSGHWMVDQRLAELCALQGRHGLAIQHLERVLERTGKPEISQALSPLYARAGDMARARLHHSQALGAFLASVNAGEVHYLHHLVEMYVDQSVGASDTTAAVRWARRDLELRPNHLTRSALAQALHRDGRTNEAVAEMTRALATGLRDPRLLAHAAEILDGRDASSWPVLV